MNKFLFTALLLTSQLLFSQDQMFEICPIKVGTEVPNTKISTAAGEEIMLTNLVANQPTVIVFYRGAWCGYCTKHLSELNNTKAEIEKLGFQIIGITVDKVDKLSESKDSLASEIEVYSDAQLETIMAFGLDWKLDNDLYDKYKNKYNLDLEKWSGEDHHSLPVPAIFIIKDNIIQFQYVNPNYRTRLKPETLLSLLQTI